MHYVLEDVFIEEFGGFDSSLDYLEDWDLWVRYAQRTKYICVEKTTSLYRVPFEQKIQKERQHQLDEALKTVRKNTNPMRFL